MFTLLLLVVGFALLIKGADVLVEGASSLARRLHISPLVVGLTVVAFGTSAPELVVNIIANLQGESALAIGNIIGSNIANILLILGVAGMIRPLSVTRNTVWREIPFSLLAMLVLAALANDALIDGAGVSVLSRIDGLVLLAFFLVFLSYSFSKSKPVTTDLREERLPSVLRSTMYITLGILGLALGGKLVVDSATTIAIMLGLSQTFIGLTLVALGTSLPELATTIVAAHKRKTDIAIGNIVGSNIFNVFWILGLSAIIHPISYTMILNRDVGVAVLASVLLMSFVLGNGRSLQRGQGFVLVLFYIVYLVTLTLS
ncbi:sodium:proton exchanger [Candidatus Uhrbacteria bacterium CG10_big_fil_rev_8_21_14_0_10_48_11]|uniref:Sodium:proton exchanger n=1 Tax=Candidatus Uhrbacteria bacterium CG10_big_fil_rev_8_21_14_0_10_48_11 TaxID=1975037 RepID=A0A2M8LEG0_9BACT|nr:MAG: sodium:proton exchanger [Candidatus Uhrbacteria bacterium CG10_big_fil_rev_8_21_14_0_10_48_11]